MQADKQRYWRTIVTKKELTKKKLKSCVYSFTNLSGSAFKSFIANVSSFVFNSEVFIRLEISVLLFLLFFDIIIWFFFYYNISFIFTSSMLIVN